MEEKKLTPKQQKFCDYYIELGNGTEAAIKAGYSKKTAKVVACENLTKPYLKEYIDTRLKEMQNKSIANQEEILEFLTKMMRGNEKDAFGLDTANSDKLRAAELLGKRYRLFTDKVEQSGEVVVRFTSENELED